MQLIGMLDSPYVRRVAICLKLLGIEFEHRAVSVFSDFERFKTLNPVVKAPTLVLADDQILMDSSLILEYAAGLVPAGQALLPAQGPARLRALQLTGLALAACEKTVQIVYEQQQRPQEKQHQPWLDRVQGQLQAAYAELEKLLAQTAAIPQVMGSAEVSVAVAWSFTQLMLPERITAQAHPVLAAFAAQAERHPAFISTPQV
ncbi:glutathione S-transferase N-terminal domain-containing protein [Serratia plymuthica]|uniref:Glutathione S-transferase n=1 Tax=Serratia plymuthica S13 TaxID=1348660 RepID=S4YER7_SERPL|nr:glutathione S-transferase N-terminal domain-containing protein [Serratia plymuthica]AGP43194.1 glutathione S-transferase [Serratia plymuthica S13]ANJ92645.1 glutathione S-transferase [Serratia plymuthica]ANJ97292.1 glutathione S-transferase [Serratia plymuthica]EKF66130.1 glutathione s-transferase protein [Serratia plymuthica A30]KYG14573.1 putative GST-like protein YibF [Serratia plymuthica]